MSESWASEGEVREIARLVSRLQHKDGEKRRASASELKRLGPGAVNSLLTFYRSRLLRNHRIRRCAAYGFAILAALGTGAAAFVTPNYLVVLFGCAVGGWYGTARVAAFAYYMDAPAIDEAISALEIASPTDEIRVLTSLMRLSRGRRVNTVVLQSQLARVCPVSDVLVYNFHRWFLQSSLAIATDKRDVALAVALLEALSRIGTASQIPSIRHSCRALNRPEVEQAMKTCVAAIEKRHASAQPRWTLLRASDGPTGDLLTPWLEQPDTRADSLLRPDINPE